MGSEFIEKVAPTLRKSWDRERANLATADLFTKTPDRAVRTVSADIVPGARLEESETLIVEVRDGKLVARRGHSVVAKFANPPSSIVAAVEDSCGLAKGTVEQIHSHSGVAEISLR